MKYFVDIRMSTPLDLPTLHSIDIRGNQFPLEHSELQVLTQQQSIAGFLAIEAFTPCGFCLYSVNGNIIDLVRIAVLPEFINHEVVETMITNLCNTFVRQSTTIRAIQSENDTATLLFQKLRDVGFRAVGLAPRHFTEYGSLVDGIKMELTQ